MIIFGCSGGFASLDLTLLLPLERILLSTYIRISPNDAKIYVENDQNVSLLDLASISSELKISFLSILESILASRHSSLIKIANSLMRPLAIVLGSDEMKQVVGLAHKALSCFQLVLQAFPTVICKNSSLGLDSVVKLFEESVEHLIKCESSIQASDATALNGFSAAGNCAMTVTAASYSSVFTTIEKTLLFCGPQLPIAIRNSIEIATGSLLLIVNKGIALPQFTDRRMKFLGKELIRTNLELQNSLLSLALAEVLSSGNQSGGIYSSNITLLRQAASLCLHQNETSAIAVKTIQTLDLCMHPTAIPLMSTPLCVTTESIIKNSDDHNTVGLNSSLPALEVSNSDQSLQKMSNSTSSDIKNLSNNRSTTTSLFDIKDKTGSASTKISVNSEKRNFDSLNSDNMNNSFANSSKKNRQESSSSSSNSNSYDISSSSINSSSNNNSTSNNSDKNSSSSSSSDSASNNTSDSKSFSFGGLKHTSGSSVKVTPKKDDDALDELPDLY